MVASTLVDLVKNMRAFGGIVIVSYCISDVFVNVYRKLKLLKTLTSKFKYILYRESVLKSEFRT